MRRGSFVVLATWLVVLTGAAGAAPQVTPRPPAPAGARGTPGAAETGTGLIVGTVVDASSGAPISGAVVTASVRAAGPVDAPGELAALERLAALQAAGLQAPAGGPTILRAFTTSDGRFLFRDLPPGTYNISTSANGYLTSAFGRQRPDGPPRPLTLGDGERRTTVSIRMWKYASISGVVVDETGAPAVGIPVRALRVTVVGEARRVSPGPTTYSDDRGYFRFGGLTPGGYLIAAPMTSIAVPVSAIDEYYTAMRSGDTGELMRERLASGAPMPTTGGLRVGDQQLQLSGIPTRTLAPPAPGPDGRILAYRTVFAPAASTIADAEVLPLASGETRANLTLQLQLSPTASVTGQVIGPDGPVSGIGVRLLPDGNTGLVIDNGFETATTVTNAAGRFVFLGVPAGSYTAKVQRVPRPTVPVDVTRLSVVGGVVMTTSGSSAPPAPPTEPVLWASAPVGVGATDVADVVLTLREGLRLSGRLVFDGASPQPPADRLQALTIRLAAVEGPTIQAQPARPDADGRFETAGYPPGRYFVTPGSIGAWSVRSILAGGRDVVADALDLDRDIDDAVITFTDRRTSLGGTVTTTTPGEVDAVVVAIPADYQGWIAHGMSIRRAPQATVAPDGRFSLGGLMPGDYLVAAFDADAPVNTQDPEFVAAMARVATPVRVAEGEQRQVSLAVARLR
ncbi:MAG: carboxypeptidase-like regulatory domain-containing protein [Vicinamibacterales bacterium]